MTLDLTDCVEVHIQDVPCFVPSKTRVLVEAERIHGLKSDIVYFCIEHTDVDNDDLDVGPWIQLLMNRNSVRYLVNHLNAFLNEEKVDE